MKSLRVKSVAALQSALRETGGIDSLYDRIFAQINKQAEPDREIARYVIMWLLYCPEPLKFNDLATSFTVDWRLGVIRESKRPPNLIDLLHVCGNLVVETSFGSSSDPPSYQAWNTLKFVHMSVPGYLRRRAEMLPNNSSGLINAERFLAFSSSEAFTEMALTCLFYLCMKLKPLPWYTSKLNLPPSVSYSTGNSRNLNLLNFRRELLKLLSRYVVSPCSHPNRGSIDAAYGQRRPLPSNCRNLLVKVYMQVRYRAGA